MLDGSQSLSDRRTLVLADDPLPGYLGLYDGEPEPATGPATTGFTFEDTKRATPGQGPAGCIRKRCHD